MTRAWLVSALCALLLDACTLGPDFDLPRTPTAKSYAAEGDAPLPADQHLAIGTESESQWWTEFQSPALDGVIALAITNNQDIAAAKARVAQAGEDVSAAEGALLPQATLGATAGRQKYGIAMFGPAFKIRPFTYYSVGPSVSFPLDLFGGGRRTVEEKAALAEYQGHDRDATYLSLTANVVAQSVALAAAKAQIVAFDGIIDDDKRNVELVQTAFYAGYATRTQLLSAQSQLETDRTLLPDFQQQESIARHALAILVGKAPADWTPPDFSLDDFVLPAEIPAVLPSELVHRRPDILAAEAQLHAASAAIGVATANLYPKVDLTGALAQQALTPGNIFNGAATAWSLAANLTQPLFDGGQLIAERRAAFDGYQVALAGYRQVILTAFGDVADRLQALAKDADRVHGESAAAEARLLRAISRSAVMPPATPASWT